MARGFLEIFITTLVGWLRQRAGTFGAATPVLAFFLAILTVSGPIPASAAADPGLQSLTLKAEGFPTALSPAFDTYAAHYTATVAQTVSTITVTPTAVDPSFNITVMGDAVVSGQASGPINLNEGENTISIAVTDGNTSNTYSIVVTRQSTPPSHSGYLSSLTTSTGTLSPTFSAGVWKYTLVVPLDQDTVDVTPTLEDPATRLEIEGKPSASGYPHRINVPATGSTTLDLWLYAPSRQFTGWYQITVSRGATASSNADLSALTLSTGTTSLTLSPGFTSGERNYTATAPNAAGLVNVIPQPADGHATITVNGNAVSPVSPSWGVPLAVGSNPIEIVVTAEDGITKKTYKVDVTRQAAGPAIVVHPTDQSATTKTTASFNANVDGATHYQWQVKPGTSANWEDVVDSAIIRGATRASMSVTAPPLSMNGYQYRLVAWDDNQGSAVSNPATLTVTASDSTLEIAPASGAIPAGNIGEPYSFTFSASGGQPPYKFVMSGDHPPGMALSQDGILSGTPTVAYPFKPTIHVSDANNEAVQAGFLWTVHPAGGSSSDASLSGLTLSTGTLAPAFSPETDRYTVYVPNHVTELSVTVTTTDADATLSIRDTPATSGAAFGPIPLEVGNNKIGIHVLAANRNNSRSYGVTAVRLPPSGIVLSPASGALTAGTVGVAYSQTVTASGGVGSYTYQVTTGDLPGGLALDPSTGTITGTPNTVENYEFTITATDGEHEVGVANYTLEVKPDGVAVQDQEIVVEPGMTPADVRLDAGATGGPFESAELVSVEPANAGRAEITWGDYAAVGPVTSVGWYLKFTPNPAFSGKAHVRFRLISGLGTSNTGTVTYTLGYDAAQVAADIDTLVRGFVQSRQSLIASSVKTPGLLERRRATWSSSLVTTGLSSSADGITVDFSTSLAQLEAARNGTAGVGSAMSPFNVWIDGTLLAHNRDQNGGKWGSFGMVSVGADYLLSEKALFGLSFHYDRMTDPTKEDAELRGNGWLAGPYASFEIGKGVFWDTSLLYGGSANDIDTAFWDGTFDTSRWMFDTSINGQWNLDDMTVLTPRLRAVYFSEEVDAYDVANDAGDRLEIEGFTMEQFRVSLGAEIARSFILGNGLILTPSLGLTGGVSGLDGSGAFGAISAGLSLTTANNWMLDAGLLFDIEGAGEKSVGAKLGVSRQF